MWYDHWGEVLEGTRAFGDRDGYPDMPPDEIPSLQKYLDDHGVGSMFWRLFNGSKRVLAFACFHLGQHRIYSYGFCSQSALGIVAIVASLLLLYRTEAWRRQPRYTQIACYLVALFAVFALGAAWYLPIMGNRGVRMILVLFIPFLWTVGLVIHTPRVRSYRITILGKPVRVFTLLLGTMYLALFYEIYMMITVRAATMYGGS